MSLVALNLDRMSVAPFILYSRNVYEQMTANADVFGASPIPLPTFNNHITELQEGYLLALEGGKANTSLRNTRRKVVEDDLRELARYVQTVSGGSADIIYLAGMTIKKVGPRRYDTLAVPGNVRTKSEREGEVSLRWRRVHNAKTYAVEYCLDPISADGWRNGMYNSGAYAAITGLTRLKDYWFRVRSLGSDGLTSDWSDPAKQSVS